jgi:hypothetical protein
MLLFFIHFLFTHSFCLVLKWLAEVADASTTHKATMQSDASLLCEPLNKATCPNVSH